MADAGIPAPRGPWRWEDLANLAERLTVRDPDGRVTRYGLLFDWTREWRLFVRSYGGRVYSADGTRSELDSPAAVAAIQMMHDLVYRYGVSPTSAEEASMSGAGGWGAGSIAWFGGDSPRAAMAIGGRWWLVQLRKYRTQDFGVVETPSGGASAFYGGGRATLINRNSHRIEGALRFVTFLSTPAYNRLINEQGDGLCAFRAYAQGASFLFNPAHPQERDNAFWRRAAELAEPEEQSSFVDDETVDRLVERQLDLVKDGTKSPAQAMHDAARAIDAAIRSSIAEMHPAS